MSRFHSEKFGYNTVVGDRRAAVYPSLSGVLYSLSIHRTDAAFELKSVLPLNPDPMERA